MIWIFVMFVKTLLGTLFRSHLFTILEEGVIMIKEIKHVHDLELLVYDYKTCQYTSIYDCWCNKK
jgi:hypothetical protein